MLAAMLQAAGRRVDRYISPHLVAFNERILIDGAPIAEERLARCLERCEAANAGLPITFFEITTAAAFLAFAERRADWVLARDRARRPAGRHQRRPAARLCLISPVSMDHESYLGDTLASIAREKAGILKPGVPAVIAAQRTEALAVIEARAAEIGAPLLLQGRDWDVRATATGLRGRVARTPARAAAPGAGRHAPDRQCRARGGGSAAAARCRSRQRGDRTRPARGALAGAPAAAGGRAAGRGRPARTPSSGSTAATTRRQGRCWPTACRALLRARALHLVVGMLSTKDLGQFLAPLLPLAASLRFVPIAGEPLGRDPAASAATAALMGARAARGGLGRRQPCRRSSPAEAAPYDILICGSLYLAGEVLRDQSLNLPQRPLRR